MTEKYIALSAAVKMAEARGFLAIEDLMVIATPPAAAVSVTEKMRIAACRALNERGKGNNVTICDVVAMLEAALSASPSPVDSRDALETERARLWRENRELRASLDVEKAVADCAIREKEALMKALEPFADAAEYYSSGIHRPVAEDALPCGPALIVKHLREARAALLAAKEQQQ